MKEYETTLAWGFLLFIIVFLVNYFLVLKLGYKNINKMKKKKKQRKLEDFIGLSYLIPRFKLDINKINVNYLFITTSLLNAFIISIVFVIVYIIEFSYPFKMMLAFVLLFGLIYALYEIFGKILVKKGWQKDEYKRN